jgi:hypothetical protein
MQKSLYAIILRCGRLTAIELNDREADELRDTGPTVLRMTLLELVRLAGQAGSLTVFPRDGTSGCQKYAALVGGFDRTLARAGQEDSSSQAHASGYGCFRLLALQRGKSLHRSTIGALVRDMP